MLIDKPGNREVKKNRIDFQSQMKTILLVEDTLALAREMEDLLVMQNYAVVTAQNGAEALAVLKNVKPDLIVTDVLMPQMDGFELLRHIRKEPSLTGIPTLIITAKAGKEVETTAYELGAHAVLKKPCRAEAFLKAIESLMY